LGPQIRLLPVPNFGVNNRYICTSCTREARACSLVFSKVKN
jgi:hypothetical protein